MYIAMAQGRPPQPGYDRGEGNCESACSESGAEDEQRPHFSEMDGLASVRILA